MQNVLINCEFSSLSHSWEQRYFPRPPSTLLHPSFSGIPKCLYLWMGGRDVTVIGHATDVPEFDEAVLWTRSDVPFPSPPASCVSLRSVSAEKPLTLSR